MEIKWNKHVVVLYDKDKDEKIAAALKSHLEKEFRPCDVILVDSASYSLALPYKFSRFSSRIQARHFRKLMRKASLRNEKSNNKRVQELLRTNGYSGTFSKRKRMAVKRILNVIKRFDPVMIMCTTPEALELTLLSRTLLGVEFRTVGVISDFSLDPAYVRADADGYFVENPEVKKSLMDCGVPEDRIAVAGYPTLLFDFAGNKNAKRAALGVVSNLPLVVVYGGKYDTHTLKKDVVKLMERKNDYILMIVTKDKKLRKYYMDLPEFSAGVLINEQLTDDILDVTDILVTIPDTHVVFEAFMRGATVIVSNGVTALEEKVRNYLVKRALVIPTRTPEETLYGVYEVLNEPQRKQEFRMRGESYVRLSVRDIRNLTPKISSESVAKISNKNT